MRVLLLNPPKFEGKNILIDPVLTRCCGTHYKAPYLWPPIGLAYIAGCLKGTVDVSILDAQAENLSTEQTVRKCEEYDLVVISTSTPTVNRDIKMCKEISSEKVKVGLMGGYASQFHKELILEDGVDFVVRGEPERVLLNLVKNFEARRFGEVRGLTWKSGNKIFINHAEEPVKNLDSLPFAARELLSKEKYHDIISKKSPITFAITSRGCPYRCTFCPSSNVKYRARTPENVFREMEVIENEGFKDVMFFDDTFTIGKERVLKLCSLLDTLNIPWRCLSRVDTVDMEMLESMYSSGCYQIHFGVESGDQNMLNKMRKDFEIEQAEQAFKWCYEVGIETVAYLMIGYPGENERTIQKTLNFVKRIQPDFITFNVFTPLPGTEMFKEVYLEGKDLEDFDLLSTSFCDMDIEEVQEVIINAYKNYYFNLSYLIRRIMKVKNVGDLHRLAKQTAKAILGRKSMVWESVKQE